MYKKSLTLFVMLILAGVLVFAACAPPEEAAEDEAPEEEAEEEIEEEVDNPAVDRGNTLQIADEEPEGIFNPLLYSSVYDEWNIGLMFDPLFALEEDGSLTTDNRSLAADYEIDEEELEFTIYLEEGVEFHDGEEFTAEDVAFTWKTLAHPEYDGRLGYLVDNIVGVEEYRAGEADEIEGINIEDDYTITVEALEPQSTQLRDLSVYMIPKHHYEFEDYDNFVALNDEPMGTGPFVLEDYVSQQYVEVTANEDYFLGEPELDSVIYQATSQEAQIPELQTGGVDAINFSSEPENVEQVEDIEFAEIIEYLNNGFAYIGINHEHPVLQDKKVRQALSYGLQRQDWVDNFFEGLGQVAHTPISPVSWAFPDEDELNQYEYDPDKANELLDEAGYEWDEDGEYRLDDDGEPIEITWTTYADVDWAEQITSLASENWSELGIDLEIEMMEFNSVTTKVFEEQDFDLFNLAWNLTADPDMRSYMSIENADPGGNNAGQYHNERAEELMEEGIRTFDQEEREEIYQELGELFNEDLPYIFVYIRNDYWGVNERIQNFEPSEFREWHWNIHEVSVDE